MPGTAPDLAAIRGAANRIAPYIVRTPLKACAEIWLKCENRQVTGSFKARGALNKVLGLSEDEAQRGLVAASAGNHGLGVAYAARLRGLEATIVVPKAAVARKVQAIREQGGRVVFVDGGYAEAEAQGKRLAADNGCVWISPYNDVDVIAGQGTAGLELATQAGEAFGGAAWEVFVPVSGGGLVCGVAAGLRAVGAQARVVGVQPEASPYLYAHFRGEDVSAVREKPTLADGLAGAVEDGSITFGLLLQLVDDMCLATEEEIREAIRWVQAESGEVIEPSAAAAVAAARSHAGQMPKVALASGGNIDPAVLRAVGSET